MSNTIRLDTGLKTYNLIFTDRDDDCVQISFNPNDIGIIERIESAGDRISKAIEENPEAFDDTSTVATEVRKLIYEQVDYIFGNAISEKVFKHCHPLSVDSKSGKYYIERFINAVAPVIKRDVEASNKASQKRMDKHLAKYRK